VLLKLGVLEEMVMEIERLVSTRGIAYVCVQEEGERRGAEEGGEGARAAKGR